MQIPIQLVLQCVYKDCVPSRVCFPKKRMLSVLCSTSVLVVYLHYVAIQYSVNLNPVNIANSKTNLQQERGW